MNDPTASYTSTQASYLRKIAQRTSSFVFNVDFDPNTGLPRNHISVAGSSSGGAYTSPTDLGFTLDAIVAAKDLGLVSSAQAVSVAQRVMSAAGKLATEDGFLLAWYDTSNGQATTTPLGSAVTSATEFAPSVDNAWYAQGLEVVAQAIPALASQANQMLGAMQWSAMYNPSAHLLSTGILGGVQQSQTYNLAYGGPRMADFIAMGSRQVPGSMYWYLLDTPPPNVGQRQTVTTTPVTYQDPQTGASFVVPQSYYTYDNIPFVPTFNGSMFEALAADQIVPEQSWAPNSLGVNDTNTVAAQECAAAQQLAYPVWGLAPAATPLPNYSYLQYGASPLSTRLQDSPAGAVTPYASFMALNVTPSAAYANIAALASLYPSIVKKYGFVDSVDPSTGSLAGRYTALSQDLILMSVDNALDHNQLQGYFATSAMGLVIEPYLQETHYTLPGT